MKRQTLQVCLVYLTVALRTAPLVNLARHTLLFSGVVFLLSKNLSSDPLPQILDGVQQNLVGKQIVDVPVPKILEPVAYRRQATARVDVHCPVPQILEQSVEVVRALSDPGADC